MHPFVPLPRIALEDLRIGKAHLLVLLSLYSFMNSKTRKCFPSISAIAERGRLSKDHTRKKINELVEMGYIKRVKTGGGRLATTYYLVDFETKNGLIPLETSSRGGNEFLPALELISKAPLDPTSRGNNKNKTINIEQYLSKERSDDLKILKICNDMRSRRFGLDPLNEQEEHLKHISRALMANSYEDVERVAKHYFATADCEFMNTYNAFNLAKLANKIQRAKDSDKGNECIDLFEDTPLTNLI